MVIREIELTQFRNYASQSIKAYPGINVFYGDNAQGKTNILEAVYFCACARSHRTSRDIEMIRHEARPLYGPDCLLQPERLGG